jgi:hypothetical protein
MDYEIHDMITGYVESPYFVIQGKRQVSDESCWIVHIPGGIPEVVVDIFYPEIPYDGIFVVENERDMKSIRVYDQAKQEDRA